MKLIVGFIQRKNVTLYQIVFNSQGHENSQPTSFGKFWTNFQL